MHANFLIIGSGISGLNFALHAAKKGKVILVTKKKIIDSNTNFAQGGIAAVLDKTDNTEKHIKDTLQAGDYHNNKRAVRFMVRHSTEAIYRLIDLGVEFEKEEGELKLTREGGHHKRRIAYVGDYTGQEIENILIKRVKEHLNVKILENAFALNLITKGKTCFGAQIIRKNKVNNIFADQTILATGGIGQIFSNTTNPVIATGDGIAMAVRAGCKVQDIEFIQFHPSAFAKKTTPRFLISETVRGEGAKLVNSKGKRFMTSRHPLKELAPRSIVAKEIFEELKNGPVFLDISHKKREFLKKRFPKIYSKLKSYGIDIAKDKIPITPAAHYLCGGIVTDLSGQTNLKNLFAFGETTCTGVHGANRLASNSLLEALVFSNQIVKKLQPQTKLKVLTIDRPNLTPSNSKETKLAKKFRKEIQTLMWQYAGIIRNRKKLKNEAIPKLKKIIQELSQIKSTNKDIAETKNTAQVSLLILKAALKRRKSLGCHYVE
ncbi:L-aspartate oxidase [Candidatus Peregrinibacteria bacterium]|nr:L-aspartate oxidase [Candidatus Peregrinibacteria bacterium]